MILQQLLSNMNSTLTRSSKESHAHAVVNMPTPRYLFLPKKVTSSRPLIKLGNAPLVSFSNLLPLSFFRMHHKQRRTSTVIPTIFYLDCSQLNCYIFASVLQHSKTNAAYFETAMHIKCRPKNAAAWCLAAGAWFLGIMCFVSTGFHLILGTG